MITAKQRRDSAKTESEERERLLPSQLMAKPALFWPEFWQDLLGIPESTAEELARGPDAPKFFLIGRRRYIRTKDAIAWIDKIAESRAYTPRTNSPRNAGD